MAIQEVYINIHTKNTSLSLKTKIKDLLYVLYFGKKLKFPDECQLIHSLDTFKPGNDDLLNQRLAYVTAGSLNLLEPALSATHHDGNNSVVLNYFHHEMISIDNNQSLTNIYLKDDRYDLLVTMHFKAYYNEDVIEQWVEIKNNNSQNVILNKYASANLTLSGNSFYLQSHHGGWGREMKPEKQKLSNGLYTIDSKLGTRTNLLHSSSFLISLDQDATETHGEVIAASLAYSGNFRIDFEIFDEYNLRITAGINNFSSTYQLESGKTFSTPPLVYTFSPNGKGKASRNLHNWARNYQICDGLGDRYTILNNWEATYFDFNETKLKSLIQDTKNLGLDVFLLDDGWFGNKYPRNNAETALGDWEINNQKLPNGIANLIKEAEVNKVKFGLWIEPEMVSPKSELYELNPSWIIRQPDLPEYYMRNQLVLDLTNIDVQNYLFTTLDKLLQRHQSLAFIKWDCNSLIYNAHSPTLKNQNHFYIDYVKGLYEVLGKLRTKYPKIPMMLCAGGGSRVDYGALKYFTEFWPSDNTNPYDRIFIQWEYSQYFPAIALDNHVTNMGDQSLKFKIDVAFMGKLGFDIQIGEFNKTEVEFAKQAVGTYNSVKNLILHGDLYRLQDPYAHKTASLSYICKTKNKALILNYHIPTTFSTEIVKPIKLPGLDPDRFYRIKEINIFPGERSPIDNKAIYSGDFLKLVGFNPQVNAKRKSVVLLVEALNEYCKV